ncbi:MAG: response regulator transcription factor [Chloroflexia bacterium]|nr:response regulator transcription factor [Chloroflexia bacterium]
MENKKTINVLLIDDHPIVLNGLKSLLDGNETIRIIADSNNGLEALSILKEKRIDLVISDISMPEMDGIEFTKELKLKYPETKVLLLTAHNEKEILKRALFSGAEACLLKNTSKKNC